MLHLPIFSFFFVRGSPWLPDRLPKWVTKKSSIYAGLRPRLPGYRGYPHFLPQRKKVLWVYQNKNVNTCDFSGNRVTGPLIFQKIQYLCGFRRFDRLPWLPKHFLFGQVFVQINRPKRYKLDVFVFAASSPVDLISILVIGSQNPVPHRP